MLYLSSNRSIVWAAVYFIVIAVKARAKAFFLNYQIASKNSNFYLFHRDDHGGFTKDTLLTVRTNMLHR